MVNYAIISAAAAAILSSAASVVNAVPIPDNSYNSGSSSSYASTATSTAASYAASSTGSSHGGSSYNGGSSSSSYSGGSSSSYNGGSYSTPMYGSGSSSWSMQSSYDSCVEQCIATYGSATVGSYDMNNNTMSSYDSSSYSGSSGSSDCSGGDCNSSSSCSAGDCGSSSCSGGDCGSSSCSGGSCGSVTHTVMVAPTQGVLRYVPFAINASVGDTIKYVWGGNNHTVSLGSQLDLCNSSSNSTSNFTSSGEHGMNFEYSVMINDTAPMYMYCATPGHCEKGMFMIINPIMSNSSSSYNMSAGNMIASMSNSTNSSIAYMQTMYSRQSGANSSMAANWGSGMNVSAVPSWAYESFLENVMYTRTFLAANNDLLNTDGSVNISKSAHPIVVPQDVTRAILNVAPAKQNKRDLDVEGQEQDIDLDEDSEDDSTEDDDDSVLESAVPVQMLKMAKRHSGARSTAAVSVLGSIVVLSVAALTAF